MNQDKSTLQCDDDGVCFPDTNDLSNKNENKTKTKKPTLIYFGDPMCSWCWGITNHLDQTINYFKDQIDFEIVMGGLRPGGGDPWNSDMKSFLKGHWQHVEKASGQEFNHGLFDLETFNYDTEPACRAIAIIKYLGANKALAFYRSIQHSFYVLNNDPNKLEFYKPICDQLNIDFYKFSELFNASKGKALVNEDFVKTKTFGVSGFPTLLI